MITLPRRIARLEATPPLPPDDVGLGGWPGDEAPPAWWGAATAPLRAYLLTIGAAADTDDHTAHELADLLDQLGQAVAQGGGLPLHSAQGVVLWWRWIAVFNGTGTDHFARFWGAGRSEVFAAYQDKSGAALVALWRRAGTRALDRPALRLLAAMEDA